MTKDIYAEYEKGRLRMPEHQTIEWKESWHDEYLEWICGYANAYGCKFTF